VNETANAFRAGLVVILAVSIGVYFFAASRKSKLNELNATRYHAYMTDASGLTAKSLISVAGLQVGEIKNIGLDQVTVGELYPNEEDRSQRVKAGTVGYIPEGTTVLEWYKRVGDDVKKGEPLVRITSEERGDLDVDSPMRGVVTAIDAQPGDTVGYGTVLGVVGLDPNDPIKVARVDMLVSNDVQMPKDTWLKKDSLGLLGAKALFVELGASEEMIPEDGRIVNVRSKTQFDEIANRVEELVNSITDIVEASEENVTKTIAHVESITGNVRKFVEGDGENPPIDELYEMVVEDVRKMVNTIEVTVKDVRKVVRKNDESVEKLLANLEQISDDVKQMTGESFGTGTDGGPGDVRVAVANIKDITDDLRVVTGTLKEALGENEGDIGDGIKQLKSSITELDTSLQNLSEITGRIERGEGTVGKLLTDERLANKIDDAVTQASDLVTGITSLETHVDLGTWYSVRRGNANVALGLKIQPKPDKFYFFEVVDDGGGIERITQVFDATLPAPVGDVLLRRESIYQDNNTLRFTANFAKRFFDFLVLRAGIIETSGGVGADLYFWDDRIQFRNDVYNWGGPRNYIDGNDPLFNQYITAPRWRSMVKIQPIPHVYVLAGVDDILNVLAYEELVSSGGNLQLTQLPLRNPGVVGFGIDFMVGVGVTFKDDDLRSILPFVPSF
jgi:phospholipid/cholesterol/gamma-HCH transport system substrate-binding protein